MSEAQNNKDVYKIYNNAHYQLLDKKENFSLIVNKALGKNATTPSTLHSCDSREIALLIEATEKTIKENEDNEVVIKSLINLSKELFRDLKKSNVTTLPPKGRELPEPYSQELFLLLRRWAS